MFKDPIDILLTLPAVFLAMSFHEFAHAYTAYLLGDPTPKNHGRLTLDPLVHVDWMGLVMFAVFGFGWAKPVRTNPSNYKNKRYGSILVSIAGPMANLTIAFAGTVLYGLVLYFFPDSNEAIFTIIHNIVFLNIIFCLLNLIPIPPLDGYQVIKNLFFRANINLFLRLEQFANYILIVFIVFGLFNKIIYDPASTIYQFFVNSVHGFLNLF